MVNTNLQPEKSWHSFSTEDTLQEVMSDACGLSNEEAEARLQRFGYNTIQSSGRSSFAKRLLNQFHDPLIYVLLAALAVTSLLQHWTDSGVIAAVIILNAFIGIIQEQKAENALASIRQLLSPNATVLRNGEAQPIAAETLVPGDVIILNAGDKVPADVRLLESQGLRTQEAILTGESLDIEKSVTPVAAEASLGERCCMAYSGTLITAGQGKGVVIATAAHSEIGRISAMLGSVKTPDTPLVRKLARFSTRLAVAIVVLVLAVFAFGVFIRGLPVEEMFMVMIAIAVSAIPEGLPAVISITLAVGVRAMARRNAIVRHLPVIEALGNATVICTDKTGTLTKNELTVTDIVTAENAFNVTGAGYAPEGNILRQQASINLNDYPTLDILSQASLLNNDASLTLREGTWELNGDPTEGALVAFALKAGHEHAATHQAWPRTDVIPFSAENPYMATLHHDDETGVIYVKGAPEKILSMCHKQWDKAGQEQPIALAHWQQKVESLAREGKRVLAVARRDSSHTHRKLQPEDVEAELTMLGLLGIMDTPREEAKPAIAASLQAGITVKMITGDHALTASSIGSLLGIPDSDKVMTGHDVEQLSDEELATTARQVNIYARMHPEHKLRLVRALQAGGEVVAMTGDGVNDAPALKMADIGIAMGKQGTEVAKEASALVLADDNFATIIRAVEEGRNIYRNIRRTIQFMLVTDGCEGLTLLAATLIGFTLPITPLQILWVNMVTSVTLSLSFAFSPYDPDVMRHPPRRLDAPIFSRRMIALFIIHVCIITAGTIGLFLYETRGDNVDTARTIAVNVLVCFQIYYLWGLSLAQKRSAAGIHAYFPLIASTSAIIILQLFFTYSPWMQQIFATAPLSLADWGIVNGVAITLLLWIVLEYKFRPRVRRKS